MIKGDNQATETQEEDSLMIQQKGETVDWLKAGILQNKWLVDHMDEA